MSEHGLIKRLKHFYWQPDSEAGEVFASFLDDFTRMAPVQRRENIVAVDGYLDETAGLNRETATTVQIRRQLTDIDRALRAAGR
jgi:hypothetical protein